MANKEDITTDVGKFVWKEVHKNLGDAGWGTFGKAIIAIENEMRERIAREIEQIDIGSSAQLNGFGMRMIAAEVARGKNDKKNV